MRAPTLYRDGSSRCGGTSPPPDALLRSVAVYRGERLVGLAPFFTRDTGRIDYRLMRIQGLTHRLGPLALPGTERQVAQLVADALAQAQPRPDLIALEGIDAASIWPEALTEAWPGRFRPWRYTSSTHPSLVVPLSDGSFEEWFAARSSNFRQQMRRARRKLADRGGQTRLAQSQDEGGRAVEAFERLHTARWAERGGSLLRHEQFAAVADAARLLIPKGDMRLWTIELEGRLVSVHVFIVAGETLNYFNGGFDESVAELKPSLLTILAAIEDAFARGERRIDLQLGLFDYKLRFGVQNAPVCWTGLVPRTRRYPLTRARLAPAQAGWIAHRWFRRLPPERRRQLKRLLRRG